VSMKLLVEATDTFDAKVLTEATGVKSYIIEGVFLQAGIKNRNGRMYPPEVMKREVDRYVSECVSQDRAVGELGHPEDPHIHMDRISHKITELTSADGKNWTGKALILDTPCGSIVKGLMDGRVKFGVSSRGVGSLRPSADGNVVGEDFFLATAGDIVHDPSAPDAFVRSLREGVEWVWQSGILVESTVQALKKELDAAPKKKAVARRLAEEIVWGKFLDAIRIKTGK
jgi:Prohead core protein serine protease